MAYRADTNDYNTLQAAIGENEYDLPAGLTGWAIDAGAHIGAVSVALALDNPGLRVVAIEPVLDNLRLLEQNVGANGLDARVIIVPGAVGAPGVATANIRHGFLGPEAATHHAFIGNSSIAATTATGYATTTMPSYSLSDLLARFGMDRVAWLKVDTEGAEYAFLSDSAVARVDHIEGEHHVGRPGITSALRRTHRVTFTGTDPHVGGFRAERK